MSGMADNEDGDTFFDDDFPDIPYDELERLLEQDAIIVTQQEQASSEPQNNKSIQRAPTHSYPQRIGKPNISASNIQSSGRKYSGNNQTGDVCIVQPDSSAGTIFDEDGLPLIEEERPQVRFQNHPDHAAQQEQWRIDRYAQPYVQDSAKQGLPLQSTRQDLHRSLQHRALDGRTNLHSHKPAQHDTDNGTAYKKIEEEALRVRVADLMRERDELVVSLHEAKDEVFARRGEVVNVRAKQSDEQKTHQRQLASLQRLKQEEAEKHMASIQAMSAENAKVASEIQFLKQELKDESRKAQLYQRRLKDQPLADKPNNFNTTPKRNHALRDGFDDDEIMIVSPVKSGRKSKQGTPTANRKRKQPTNGELNTQPLPLRLSGTGTRTEAQSTVATAKPSQIETIVRKDRATELHLRLIQKVTTFRPSGSQDVLIKCLFSLSFPSETAKTFGSIAIDAIAKLEGPRLPGGLMQIFINLWSRAMKEQYHVCLPLLIEVISYILNQDPFVVDAAVLNNIVPLLQTTIEINATARFKLMKKEYLTNPPKPKPVIDPYLKNTSCLELLHTIACLVSDDGELISLFWRKFSTDFVLLMLNACQTIPDITLMLHILATSILPETFGMICDVTEQNRYETYVCERVCYLLWEIPKPDSDKPSYSGRQICLLRQEALNLLVQLTLGSSPNPFNPSTANNHGTNFLVNHPTAIARLIRSIYDELAAAYLMTSTQHLHIQLVNTAVRILHFVLFSPAGRQMPWQGKIAGVNGGPHKFRVALARLAYAEGTEPGIDAGITEDTVRMATEMLEESVTPDEVEDLVRVFEGEGSSSSRRTSAMGSAQR